MELGATKDDFIAFREKCYVERSGDVSSDVIFNYGYGCCAYEHNIRGSKPKIPPGMPDTSTPLTPEFLVNPRCPSRSSFASLPYPSRLLKKI